MDIIQYPEIFRKLKENTFLLEVFAYYDDFAAWSRDCKKSPIAKTAAREGGEVGMQLLKVNHDHDKNKMFTYLFMKDTN